MQCYVRFLEEIPCTRWVTEKWQIWQKITCELTGHCSCYYLTWARLEPGVRSWKGGCGVCCLRELSGLVQGIYWADFFNIIGVVYCHGLVGYARVWKISMAPFMILQWEGGYPLLLLVGAMQFPLVIAFYHHYHLHLTLSPCIHYMMMTSRSSQYLCPL